MNPTFKRNTALFSLLLLTAAGCNVQSSAIFSPQPIESGHTARIRQMVDAANSSIDIAMYSYSDADIGDALEGAIDRGVSVRFIFETANDDKKLSGPDLLNSKSGRLESAGVDVRFVKKIMHHKFIMVDGPRDDIAKAATAKITSGSANWSFNGAAFYDENTVFLRGQCQQASDLKSLIIDNCPEIFSEEFRTSAPLHRTCAP